MRCYSMCEMIMGKSFLNSLWGIQVRLLIAHANGSKMEEQEDPQQWACTRITSGAKTRDRQKEQIVKCDERVNSFKQGVNGNHNALRDSRTWNFTKDYLN